MVEPDGCTVTRLELETQETIDGLVQSYRAAVTDVENDTKSKDKALALDQAGEALRLAVWDPVAATLPAGKRVWVVTDGRLGEVPIDALPEADGTYLIEQREFGHLAYPASAVRLGQAPAVRPSAGAFVVGDINYGRAATSDDLAVDAWDHCGQKGCRGSETGRPEGVAALLAVRGGTRGEAVCGYGNREWSRLSTEAAGVAAALGRVVDGGALLAVEGTATEGAVRRALPGRRVIHLATHGFYAPKDTCGQHASRERMLGMTGIEGGLKAAVVDPLRLSALVLAGANDGTYDPLKPEADRLLSAREVAGLDLRGTDLVTLSACQTGLGERVAGEVALGLGSAFLAAGARVVIVAKWKVPDAATAELFTRFYREAFVSGGPVDAVAAFRKARLEMIDELRKQGLSHSAHRWGGFAVLTGGG